MLDRTAILAINPKILRVRQGWLAVSQPGSPLGIGVQAETEEEAREGFGQALQRWAALVDDFAVSSL